MKVDRFIVVCILFLHFLVAQQNYVSPIREANELIVAGKFVPTLGE